MTKHRIDIDPSWIFCHELGAGTRVHTTLGVMTLSENVNVVCLALGETVTFYATADGEVFWTRAGDEVEIDDSDDDFAII